jgi:1-piperideine-2-carboxylate/1-pyrroline-2-carboxylate reductase [NAD(P)H]
MKFLDGSATKSLLPYPALRDALIDVFRTSNTCRCPPRTHIPLGTHNSGSLLLMAATDADFAVTKVVTIHPSNTAPTPTIQSDVVVIRTADGARLLQCDGNVVTERRTSAVSAAALTLLLPLVSNRTSGPFLRVLIVGGGVQANAHREAISACFEGASFRLCPRKYKGLTGAAAFDVSPKDLQWANVIVTATSSHEPVVTEEAAAMIGDDVIICAVGAYTPSMAEVPPALVKRCRVVVDTMGGCETEAGDLIQAGVDFNGVESISAVAVAAAELRPCLTSSVGGASAGPILFKSVGSALWELAAARCMVSQSPQ